jgi:isocitrate dehydrogenase (NAD+)
MPKHTVVTMPGDGIGKVVLPEALRVLDAVGFDAEYVHADIGWDFWITEGNALPQRTIDLLEQHRLGLFGAITSKPKGDAARELSPELRDKGYVYYSPIVGLRQRFDLDISIRPCRSFAGNPLNFIRRGPDGGVEEPKVDAVIFRQNTEDLYAGVEWTDPPAQVRAALGLHPKFERFAATPGPDLAISTRIFTRHACNRIMRAAFDYAAQHGYRSVTVCEKPNVVRETSGMMEDEARRVQQDYPDIQLWSTNIDAQMMWLTKNPEDYGVIVAGNMFGDIASDAFAGLVGGLGFACSANIGEVVAVFEPTHGSAPKYEKLDPPIINPIAMFLTAAMLLDHVGEQQKAGRIRAAVAAVVAEGRVRTYDMMRITGGADVIAQGAATTTQMTDAVLAALRPTAAAAAPAGAPTPAGEGAVAGSGSPPRPRARPGARRAGSAPTSAPTCSSPLRPAATVSSSSCAPGSRHCTATTSAPPCCRRCTRWAWRTPVWRWTTTAPCRGSRPPAWRPPHARPASLPRARTRGRRRRSRSARRRHANGCAGHGCTCRAASRSSCSTPGCTVRTR